MVNIEILIKIKNIDIDIAAYNNQARLIKSQGHLIDEYLLTKLLKKYEFIKATLDTSTLFNKTKTGYKTKYLMSQNIIYGIEDKPNLTIEVII